MPSTNLKKPKADVGAVLVRNKLAAGFPGVKFRAIRLNTRKHGLMVNVWWDSDELTADAVETYARDNLKGLFQWN